MIVAAVAVLVMALGLTAAVCVMQAWVIRTMKATERRQALIVRTLQGELGYLSDSARVLTLWRNRKVAAQ